MEKTFLKMMNTIVEEAMKSPGAGAQRAVAVIGTLGTKEEIPWDRISKFKVGWVNMSDGTVFPNIELEFYKNNNTADVHDGYGKVVIDDDVHVYPERPDLDGPEVTLCDLRLEEANYLYTEKLDVTCPACLARMEI
jgi:hypothetical protein